MQDFENPPEGLGSGARVSGLGLRICRHATQRLVYWGSVPPFLQNHQEAKCGKKGLWALTLGFRNEGLMAEGRRFRS